jgi:hypothetical protein
MEFALLKEFANVLIIGKVSIVQIKIANLVVLKKVSVIKDSAIAHPAGLVIDVK